MIASQIKTDKLLEISGWIGGILLALCGLPEVIVTVARGYCLVSWGMLLVWMGGEVFTFIPIILRIPKVWLIFNYASNIVFVAILIVYKIFSPAPVLP